jgi:branched-chain amino acid transport system ATP-binding protein
MAETLLEARSLSCRFGGLLAVDSLDLAMDKGSLAGLIGPNGAGKTTCFNMLTGRVRPSAGRIKFKGQAIGGLKPSRINHLGMARTFQNIRLFDELTVMENVLVGFHGGLKANFLSAIFRLPGYRREERLMHSRGEELLDLVGLAAISQERARNLAYGQQRLLEIARALATGPELILLDEPAAGMNANETANLARLVRRLRDEMGLTVLLIEHDMRFVMNLCETLTVLDHGKVIARGTPQEVQSNAAVIEAYLGAEVKAHQPGDPQGEGGHA